MSSHQQYDQGTERIIMDGIIDRYQKNVTRYQLHYLDVSIIDEIRQVLEKVPADVVVDDDDRDDRTRYFLSEFLSRCQEYEVTFSDVLSAGTRYKLYDPDESISRYNLYSPDESTLKITLSATDHPETTVKEQVSILNILFDHILNQESNLRFYDLDDLVNSIKGFRNSLGLLVTHGSILVAAVNTGREPVVRLLLEKGRAVPQHARRSSRDSTTLVSEVGGQRYPQRFSGSIKQKSPLMHSSQNGHVGITKALLAALEFHMFPKKKPRDDRWRKLYGIYKEGFCPIADVYDEQAKNALMHACSEGHIEVVKHLIAYAVRWTGWRQRNTNSSSNPLEVGSSDCDYYDDEVNIDSCNIDADAEIIAATTTEDWKRKCMSKIVNSYKVDTALWYACGHGHADIVRLLLDCGALPEYRADGTVYSSTPLMEAAEWGHLDVVRVLLGCDGIDPRSPTGRKAYRLAKEPGYTKVVDEMNRWTRRLDGLDTLLTTTTKTKPICRSSKNETQREKTNVQNIHPSLLPIILEKTEHKRTMMFQLVKEYSEILIG